MQNVSNLSILTMLVMYMMSALFGYLTFYGEWRRASGGRRGTSGLAGVPASCGC